MPDTHMRLAVVLVLGVLAVGCSPRAEERSVTIERDRQAVRSQCLSAAGGDWDGWQRATRPSRESLKARVEELAGEKCPKSDQDVGQPPLAAKDDFPLFEIAPRDSVRYLFDGESLDSFRRDRPVVAVCRWLQERGVDLILVPVPAMTEIHVEHFIDPTPSDGIVAPHVRRCLLELLESGVETIDLFPIFRTSRRPDPEFLYNAADTHWAPKGMRVAAREIARRIARYEFGAEARHASPIVQSTLGPYDVRAAPDGMKLGDLPRLDGWQALSDEQRIRAGKAQTRTCDRVTMNGRLVPNDPRSPVLLIGNSYGYNLRELLVKETNLLLRSGLSDHSTTEPFADILRDPSALRGVRVVLWVTTMHHMTHFKPLPPPIAAYARP